VVRLANYLSLN